jgi:hypothetical protein
MRARIYHSMTVFVYEKKEHIQDGLYIANEDDFKKINFRNYAKYFFRGAPLPKAGFRTIVVLNLIILLLIKLKS